MLLVIFGAGASYDSVPTYLPGVGIPAGDAVNKFYRPPLASELFENRPMFAEAVMRFPECQPIVPRLRALAGESLEAALLDLKIRAIEYPRGLQQLAAVQYYLQYILWECAAMWRSVAKGVSNYKTLLDQIERTDEMNRPVCLVTFNYDTLLEDALSDFGLSIEAFSDYTNKHPFYRIFKVHGSVNWGRIIDNKMLSLNPNDIWSVSKEWIRRVGELRITDKYVLSPGYPTAVVDGRPAFPAIAIPVEKGKSFACPPSLIEELTALLPHTTRALVIGWRGAEEHFLRLLSTHLNPGIRLHIVSGSSKDGEEAQRKLCTALTPNRPVSVTLSNAGFTDFILSGKAEEFLRH